MLLLAQTSLLCSSLPADGSGPSEAIWGLLCCEEFPGPLLEGQSVFGRANPDRAEHPVPPLKWGVDALSLSLTPAAEPWGTLPGLYRERQIPEEGM